MSMRMSMRMTTIVTTSTSGSLCMTAEKPFVVRLTRRNQTETRLFWSYQIAAERNCLKLAFTSSHFTLLSLRCHPKQILYWPYLSCCLFIIDTIIMPVDTFSMLCSQKEVCGEVWFQLLPLFCERKRNRVELAEVDQTDFRHFALLGNWLKLS